MTAIQEAQSETRPVFDQPARVTLSRTDRADVQQRQIYARLDDGPSHTLIFGDAITLEIPAGDHRLRANNTLFWKQVAFSLEPGDQIEFVLINRAGLLGFGFLALLGVAPLTLSIERR
ncbi:MAG TPA: hypothetical protein VJN96_03315 [Vicinamibacterales bacterium]|nr:hypothetical protein [Vicinamibacterales bacterium]